MYLNVELELVLVAKQKCLVQLYDYFLGLNTKKLWLQHTFVKPIDNLEMFFYLEIERDICWAESKLLQPFLF